MEDTFEKTFEKAVSQIISERGIDVVGTVQFYGLLNDSGAFNGEKPAVKNIVRTLNGSPELADLIRTGRKRTLSPSEVKGAVGALSDRFGFDRALVSRSLVGILKGARMIPKSFRIGEDGRQPEYTKQSERSQRPPKPPKPPKPQNQRQPDVQTQSPGQNRYDAFSVSYGYPSSPVYYPHNNSDVWRKIWGVAWKVGLAGLGVFLLIKWWWVLLIIIVVIVFLVKSF